MAHYVFSKYLCDSIFKRSSCQSPRSLHSRAVVTRPPACGVDVDKLGIKTQRGSFHFVSHSAVKHAHTYTNTFKLLETTSRKHPILDYHLDKRRHM